MEQYPHYPILSLRFMPHKRVIHYNNKTNKIIIDLQNEDLRDIKEVYNFQITDNNEQVFEY